MAVSNNLRFLFYLNFIQQSWMYPTKILIYNKLQIFNGLKIDSKPRSFKKEETVIRKKRNLFKIILIM